jgi:hypothetical protein
MRTLRKGQDFTNTMLRVQLAKASDCPSLKFDLLPMGKSDLLRAQHCRLAT